MCAFECVPLVAVHEVVAVSEDRLPSQIWRSDSGADRQTRVGTPRTTSSTISKGAPGAVRVSFTGRLSRKADKHVNELVPARPGGSGGGQGRHPHGHLLAGGGQYLAA